MKVIQVNSVYNKGSTGKITYDIHSELTKRGFDSIVCYGRGEMVDEKNVYKICGEFYSHVNHFFANVTGIIYGGCYLSTKRLERIILKEKPDIVHLQCINGYFVNIYRLIEWLKKKNIKTVLTLHAEFMFTANCGSSIDCDNWKYGCTACTRYKEATESYFLNNTAKSWKKMYQAFEGFDDNLIIVSVSPWLKNRAIESPIFKDKNHEVILNGLNTNIFKFTNNLSLKEKYAPKKEKILLHVTPYFSADKNNIKGGYYILKLAKLLEGENVKILIVGNYDESIVNQENITFLGRLDGQNDLAELYSIADLTILTSKQETFSMVTAESLCCGTPVVGFKAGGPEQIALKSYSKFVDFGEIQKLKKEILSLLDDNFDKNKISMEARSNYSKEMMCKNYIEIYKKMCGDME